MYQIPSIKGIIEKEFENLAEKLKNLYIDDINNKFSIIDVNKNL